MKRFVPTVLTLTAAIFCLAGCGKKTETMPGKNTANHSLPEPPMVVKCEPGILGGRLVVAAVNDPKTFNPITENESSSDALVRLMFASLLGFDDQLQQVEPGLAESWTNSPDGKTWTFKLRKNLRWSDGVLLTADDVIFTWNDVVMNPKIDNVRRDRFIIGGKTFELTKVDDLTIKVVTPEIYAPLLEFFGGLPILPKHILAKAVADGTFISAYGVDSDPQDIVGSGPFRLKAYKPAQYTLLERNPYFFQVDTKGQRLPYFDNLVYTVVPNMNAINLRFLSGESDAIDMINPDAYDQFKTAAANGRFELKEPGIGLETTAFWFNENTNVDAKTGKPLVDPVKLKWFRDTKFRQACSYAIDREAIAKSVFAGRAVPNYAAVTTGNEKWYNPDIPQFPQDFDKARALLEEIGIKDRDGDGFVEDAEGNKIEFVFNTNTGNDTRDKSALIIVSDLKKLGFNVTFQPLEFNTLIQKTHTSYNYECVLLGNTASVDPGSGMNVHKSTGFSHQWFPRQPVPSTDWEARIDHLMDTQMGTLDTAERKQAFGEVQKILAEQQPKIYTVTPYYYAAIRSDIGNARPTPLSLYRVTWNAPELYFKK